MYPLFMTAFRISLHLPLLVEPRISINCCVFCSLLYVTEPTQLLSINLFSIVLSLPSHKCFHFHPFLSQSYHIYAVTSSFILFIWSLSCPQFRIFTVAVSSFYKINFFQFIGFQSRSTPPLKPIYFDHMSTSSAISASLQKIEPLKQKKLHLKVAYDIDSLLLRCRHSYCY